MSENDIVHPEDHYQIVSQLAEGSRARIYLANDTKEPGRQVVIKFLREDVFENNRDEEAISLKHEAECLSLAAHANVVVKIGTNVNAQGKPYMVMEHLRGKSFKKFLSESPTPATIVSTLLPLTFALDNMHKIGVLHLDLRPDKIILEPSDKVPVPKLLGFGRARFLPWAGREQQGDPLPKSELYSVQFSSPEQVMDKRCLPASDLYSLGCIFYEALAGRPPFEGDNGLHIMAQTLSAPAQPMSVVRGDPAIKKYDDVVLQLLAKEPHKRYVDGAEVRDAFAHVTETPSSGGWMAKLFKK